MASIGYEKHFILLIAIVSVFCASIHCKDKEESSSFICKDTGNCKDVTSDLCQRFPHLKKGCAATCQSCICKDAANCTHVTNTLCDEHTSVRDQCHKTCGVCRDQVDNLLLISGYSSGNSNIELVSIERKTEICNPHLFDIDYQVMYHSSVLTRNGVVTCGGINAHNKYLASCILQTKNGTRPFPSMNRSRAYFELALNNDKLFAISGDDRGGLVNTMETIDINGNQWSEVPLPFNRFGHCVVSMNNKIVVMGGGNLIAKNPTWILNTLDNEWTPGPQMNEKRHHHSCFQDLETNSIYVVGGYGHNEKLPFASTEKLNMERNTWEYSSDFPIPISFSAAVASKSKKYIGFVAGGMSEKDTNKIWGLQRSDHKWIEMPQKLKTRRTGHTMVNLDLDEMPEC